MDFVFYDPIEAQEWYSKQNHFDYINLDYDPIKNKYTFWYSDNINHNKILNIEDLGYTEEYVYDIETEDGTFQAGVGSNIVKNTDSIYTTFSLPGQKEMSEDEKIKKIYKVSEECASRISETFKNPIELEMEDLKYPISLFSKKRYVFRQFEKAKNGEIVDKGITAKGIQTVRRDNCKYVKNVCNPILEEMMYGRDIEKSKKMAREAVIKLLNREVDIYDLVITKSLKEKYKTVNSAGHKMSPPSHFFLAEKMKKRDPGTAPKPGSRVSYVFIENKDRNALQADRVENPEWVLEHPKACKIDALYYLNKQLASPLETIFQTVIFNKDNELYPLDKNNKLSKEYKREFANLIWSDVKLKYENELKGQKQICDFFTKKQPKIEDLSEIESDDEII